MAIFSRVSWGKMSEGRYNQEGRLSRKRVSVVEPAEWVLGARGISLSPFNWFVDSGKVARIFLGDCTAPSQSQRG